MSQNQFFLSYSRKQLYFAEALSLALQKTGLDVWMDIQQLEPGSDWQNQIDEGLRNCSALVLVASKQSLSSPYVESEWRAVVASGKPIYLACYEEVILPSALESASMVDFRGSFQKAVDVLAAALKNLSNIRQRVHPPNRFRLPQKMPPMIMLFAGLLIFEALFAPLQVFSNRSSTLFKMLLVVGGCLSLLWMTRQFLQHRLVILVSRWALWSLPIYFFFPPQKRFEAIPGIGWYIVTCLPIIFLGVATYLLPYSRFGADLLRWSEPGADMGVDTLRRRFNTARLSKDNQAQVIRHQILTARNSEQKHYTNVKPSRDMPMLPPISSGEETRTYSLHFAAVDNPVANSLRQALNGQTLQEVDSNAQTHIVVLSEYFPRSKLQELLDSGYHLILLLISNLVFEGDVLLERAASHQLIDYRDRSKSILTALAQTLRGAPEGNLPIGYETNPQPLNTLVLPTQILVMSMAVLNIGGWLVVSGLASLAQSFLSKSPVLIWNLAGFVCGLLWIKLGKDLAQRTTTNIRILPVVLISTWLFAPLCFGPISVSGESLTTHAPFEWTVTLGSLFTHISYWSYMLCPGVLVVLWTAILWHRHASDWLPAFISMPEHGDVFKPLVMLIAQPRRSLLGALFLGILSTFGLPAVMYTLFALLRSRP